MSSAKEESIKSVIDPATGEFKRPAAQFRNFISSEPGAEFLPEKGRYHLYVSYACPWGKLHVQSYWDWRLTIDHSPQNFDRTKTQRTGGYY